MRPNKSLWITTKLPVLEWFSAVLTNMTSQDMVLITWICLFTFKVCSVYKSQQHIVSTSKYNLNQHLYKWTWDKIWLLPFCHLTSVACIYRTVLGTWGVLGLKLGQDIMTFLPTFHSFFSNRKIYSVLLLIKWNNTKDKKEKKTISMACYQEIVEPCSWVWEYLGSQLFECPTE